MDQQQIIADLEARARQAGVSMSELCSRAGVHPTTVSRWKQADKFPLTFRTLDKLRNALDELASQQAAA